MLIFEKYVGKGLFRLKSNGCSELLTKNVHAIYTYMYIHVQAGNDAVSRR